VDRAGGHLVSRYPIAPAVLALPIAIPLYGIQDRIFPGWERDLIRAMNVVLIVGRLSAIVLVVAACLALFALLKRIVRPGIALAVTLIVALGSEYWAVASQALWQHGPAALMLTLAMLALLPPEVTRLRALLGGLATALMVACRITDIVPALAILGFMVARHRSRLGWFLPGPILIGGLLIFYNYFFFGNLIGGQAALEAMHPQLHGMAGPWSGHLLSGMAGTLFSPARGLFVYCPWVALSLAVLPWTYGRLRPWPVLVWLTAALVPMLLLLSKYAVWWAGHSFGPRYWTDLTPIFGVLLAVAFDWAYERARPFLPALALASAIAIAIQAVGAYCFPSTWNIKPVDVDRHHERLWDWHDTELSRGLAERFPGRKT
jgi:hypothetical protein